MRLIEEMFLSSVRPRRNGRHPFKSMKTTLALSHLSTALLFPLSASETYSPGDFLSALTVSDFEKEPLWEITGVASIGLAKGNADSNNYGLQALATYQKDHN